MMTDIEIRDALIDRDGEVTQRFFYKDCRPLFVNIIRRVFNYDVDYDECISELYIYIMEDDARRLRQYEGRSSIYQWMKIVATRFIIAKRNRVIEDRSQDPLIEKASRTRGASDEGRNDARMDVKCLLENMSNKRYVLVIKRLMLEDADPDEVAEELGVTVDNLYNIKKRAMSSITELAIKMLKQN